MAAKTTQAILDELLETLKDGEQGYSTALTDVEDHDLKDVFKKYALQRDGYLTELEDQMHQLNLKTEDKETGSVTATIHRAFINLKAAVTSKDRSSILNECDRGEEYAVKAYETALQAEGLPAQLKPILEKQYAGIKQGRDEIQALLQASK